MTTMTDTELLSLIEHHKWLVEPLVSGEWCISTLGPDRRFVRLALSREPLRDTLRQAMRRQIELATAA
jgi:hypothetical protein